MVIILILMILTACGSATEYDLTGVVVLRENASTYPSFSSKCSGSGELAFIGEGASITITSGGDTLYKGKLLEGRGSQYADCEIPFSGTLIEADKYEVTIAGINGNEWSATCQNREVTKVQGEIAFFKLHIYPDRTICMTTKV